MLGRRGFFASAGQERGFYGIRIRRFRQIIYRAKLHRRHRRYNIAITGQHDDTAIRAHLAQGANHVQAAAIVQPQVDHRIGRRKFAGPVYALLD